MMVIKEKIFGLKEGWNWRVKNNIAFPMNWIFKNKYSFSISTPDGYTYPKKICLLAI